MTQKIWEQGYTQNREPVSYTHLMRSAAQAAQKLMQTPEGARLAAQLRHIFGK